MVSYYLRINCSLEYSACEFQLTSKFRSIYQIAVVGKSQSSLYIIENQWLCILYSAGTGCRISHMTHADISL